jgi:beta-lactamase class A
VQTAVCTGIEDEHLLMPPAEWMDRGFLVVPSHAFTLAPWRACLSLAGSVPFCSTLLRGLHASAATLLFAALALSSAPGCHPAPAVVATAPGAPALPAPAVSDALAAALAPAFARAEAEAQGHLGAAVLHLESGERASYHGGERFPMQSVFKMPLAIDILARVDAGELRLDETIHIRPIDIRPGPPNALADELPPTGGDRPLLDLLERILLISDNTAADTLLARIGGPSKVTARLRGLGINDIDVSRSEAELMMDLCGVATYPPRDTWTVEGIREAVRSADRAVPGARSKALPTYLADPRDTATPEAMASLLARVHRRDLLLKKESAERLVAILERVQTGKNRLKGLLPPGTIVAHKTGGSDEVDGITATANDAGIITLPGGAGHVIVVAFLAGSHGNEEARNHAIAQLGRAVFDHYAPR